MRAEGEPTEASKPRLRRTVQIGVSFTPVSPRRIDATVLTVRRGGRHPVGAAPSLGQADLPECQGKPSRRGTRWLQLLLASCCLAPPSPAVWASVTRSVRSRI